MTTKTPSSVLPAPDKSLERIAYASVASIPTADPHDQDRLGYCVWRWLTNRRDTLEVAVKTAGARLTISQEEALKIIRDNLQNQGITL